MYLFDMEFINQQFENEKRERAKKLNLNFSQAALKRNWLSVLALKTEHRKTVEAYHQACTWSLLCMDGARVRTPFLSSFYPPFYQLANREPPFYLYGLPTGHYHVPGIIT